MGGKMSRNKGYRVEILVRDELRSQGWHAERVPLSGASAIIKGDLHGTKDGRTCVFEVKARAGGFETLDKLFAQYNAGGILRLEVATPTGEGRPLLITLADCADRALAPDSREFPAHFISLERRDGRPEFRAFHRRAERKLLTIQKFLQGADILVVRSDRMPCIYIRYTQT